MRGVGTVKLTTRGQSKIFVRTFLAGTRHLSPIGKSSGSEESMMNVLEVMPADSKQV